MRPHPGAHTHWSITRKYPPPMGATSSRPYPRGHIPKCDPIQGHIPIGLLLGRTPPPPHHHPLRELHPLKNGVEKGVKQKKYTWKGTPTLRGVSNIPTVNLFG